MDQSLLLAITDTSGLNNNNKILLEMFAVAAALEGIFVFFVFVFFNKNWIFVIKSSLPQPNKCLMAKQDSFIYLVHFIRRVTMCFA